MQVPEHVPGATRSTLTAPLRERILTAVEGGPEADEAVEAALERIAASPELKELAKAAARSGPSGYPELLQAVKAVLDGLGE